MAPAPSDNGGGKKFLQNLGCKVGGKRAYLGSGCVIHGRIILEQLLGNQGGRVWTRLIRFRAVADGGFL